jgi:hypothetical protein
LYNGSQTAPTTDTWNLAGVEGVTAANLATANAYLAPVVTGNSDSTSELQAVADAVNALLLAADGSDNHNAALTQAQFQLLGASSIDTPEEVGLLNSVIDLKTAADVDAPSDLATLAGIVSKVMTLADTGASTPALTTAELSALGITGVSEAQLAVVLQAIADATPADITSLDALQALVTAAVNAQANALTTLVGYANTNTGTAPAESVYTTAGVTGLQGNATLLAAVNTALASTAITGTLVDTTAEVQTIVDAYAAILAEANGSTTDATPGTNPTAATYQAVGVTLGAIATNANGLSLLNDLVGERSASAVDSVNELNTLADAVNRLLVVAAGGTPTPALTAAELNNLLGISTVTPENLASVLQTIAASTDNGSGINSLASLQTVVASGITSYGAALDVIGNYADTNTGTLPDLATYTTAGVTGLTLSNGTPNTVLLAAVNSALASTPVDNTDVSTTAAVQAVVDAFALVLAEANGALADATANDPTAATYQTLGVNLGGIATNADALALLNDVIGEKAVADVDSIADLDALAAAINRLTSAPQTLTLEDLALLGMSQATAETLANIQAAIANGSASYAPINSVADLSAAVTAGVNAYTTALAVIRDYAQSNTGTLPVLSTFTQANVSGVDASNLGFVQQALASAALVGVDVDTTAEIQCRQRPAHQPGRRWQRQRHGAQQRATQCPGPERHGHRCRGQPAQ